MRVVQIGRMRLLSCGGDPTPALPVVTGREQDAVDPLNSIADVGRERVTIWKNIWSLLRCDGTNFTGEGGAGKVGGGLGNGLPTNFIQT